MSPLPVLYVNLEILRNAESCNGLKIDQELDEHDPAVLHSRVVLIHNFCSLAHVLMLAVPHRGSVMDEPDSPGGPVMLFVIGENGNVGFPSGFSRTGNLLFGPRKQSQSVGHSEHVFVYPEYQLPILIVSPDCLVRVNGHVLIVVLARVSSQLVCDGVSSPVVFADLTIISILLHRMSWDPFNVYGFSAPRNDSFLPKLQQIPVWLVNPSRWLMASVLDCSEAFDNRLVVNSNRDGSRSVRSDNGGSKLHARGAVDGGTHSLLPDRHTAPRLREFYLDVVQRVSGRVSVNVGDANPSVGGPLHPRQKD